MTDSTALRDALLACLAVPRWADEVAAGAPYASAEALADALARYVQDPALRARHGAAARARIEDKYSMAAMLGAYTALYDGLCARKAPARLRPIVNS